MHAVVRTYSGAGVKQLAAAFEKGKKDIEKTLGEIDGLISYSLVSTGDGAVSVTVCRDKAIAEESTRAAAQWIRENAPDVKATPPTVQQGKVIVHIG